MPTPSEWMTLFSNGSSWTAIRNCDGRKFVSRADTSVYLFVCAGGYYNTGSHRELWEYGRFWTSRHRDGDWATSAWFGDLSTESHSSTVRYLAHNVRACATRLS